MMKKIKVGVLPLYIKLYDDSGTNRSQMIKCLDAVVKMIEAEDIEVVRADVCRIKPEFNAAAELFNKEDVDAVVTFHLAYSPSLESIDALCAVKAPVIVCDTTLTFNMSERMDPSDITPNHGIHGVMDMCNLLKRRGKTYFVEAGHLLHSDVVARVAALCRAATVAKSYKSARIGSMGGSFAGMGDFFIDAQTMKKDIGGDIVYFDFEKDYKKYISMVTDKEIEDELAWDAVHFAVEVKNPDNYRKATRMGLALRKWAEDQKLSAYTVNFLKMNEDKMPFLELSKAMMKGFGYAGEGDTLTAGLVGALLSVYPDTTFTETFCPCWKKDLILMSHMGEMNLNLSSYKPVLCDKPFNYTPAGDTVGAYGAMRAGKATFVNLAPMADGYVLTVVPVEMLDIAQEFGPYRHVTEGWMKTNLPLIDYLKKYSEIGGTHHSALVYNVEADEIAAFGAMMGFKVEIIK
jgi:L-arabinose isomerase